MVRPIPEFKVGFLKARGYGPPVRSLYRSQGAGVRHSRCDTKSPLGRNGAGHEKRESCGEFEATRVAVRIATPNDASA